MKARNLFSFVLLFVALTVQAQGNGGRQRMNPTEIYTQMATRLAKQMKLDDDKSEVFKVLYLDYQTARHNAANPKGQQASNDERVEFKDMTDEQATQLVQKRFATQEAQLAVDKEYYTKFLDILTPVQAAQIFVQRSGGMLRQGMQGGQRGFGGQRGGGFGNGGGFGGGFGGGDN